MKLTVAKLMLIVVISILLASCAHPRFTITDPVVSSFKYDVSNRRTIFMKIVDQRSDTVFDKRSGYASALRFDLENMQDPVGWFSHSLETEFLARGIPVKIIAKDDTTPPNIILTIKKYQIVSREVNGWSPWESYLSFKGVVTTSGKNYTIRAYFFHGKSLQFSSLKAIVDSCFSMPLSIVVNEIATKINAVALHYSVAEAKVQEIAKQAEEKIKKKDRDAYVLMLELGGTNNRAALKPLIGFADVKDDIARACAISAIGMIGAKDQLEFLKIKYSAYEEIDKYMALKSIGDIGSPEANAFVRKAKEHPYYINEPAFKYCVDLYLD
jgi:hypothetical protein